MGIPLLRCVREKEEEREQKDVDCSQRCVSQEPTPGKVLSFSKNEEIVFEYRVTRVEQKSEGHCKHGKLFQKVASHGVKGPEKREDQWRFLHNEASEYKHLLWKKKQKEESSANNTGSFTEKQKMGIR